MPLPNTPSVMQSSPMPFAGQGNAGLRKPPMDSTTHVLIALAVIAPVLFIILLCLIAYCIYRCHKNRSGVLPTRSPIVPADRFNAPLATVIHNTQHSPFIFDELPPAYDLLIEGKKDPHASGAFHSKEQVQLPILPHSTSTNINERVATTELPPSAPPYIYSDRSNKQ